MVKGLTQAGHSVTLYCSVSSAPSDWLIGHNPIKGRRSSGRTWPCESRRSRPPNGVTVTASCDGTTQVPKFDEILRRNPGSRVIIALGTNSLPGAADPSYRQMMEKVVDSKRKCDWIGPPHLQPRLDCRELKNKNDALCSRELALGKFYESLIDIVGERCGVVDSREATSAGTPGNQTVDGIHATPAAAAYRFQKTKGKILSGSRPLSSSARRSSSAR